MSIKFRPIARDDYEAVRKFLSVMGWEHRVADREKFKKLMEHTSRTVVAYDDARIVGFARALCDEVSNGYISMVTVADDKRRQGLGRELVRRLTGDDVEITWVLRAGHDSDKFWEKIGFDRSSVAMERVRAS
jgi:N-acetylglutamate synthase-like GNAT family acetyltransferase